MNRPVTLVSGQWADLRFEELCRKVEGFGFDGIEIACSGDHLDIRKAASDPFYVDEKKQQLAQHDLGCWALSAHLQGQCVGDAYDERLDDFAPESVRGKPDKIREWAIGEMMLVPQAAANMGCSVVTCFMGSPIWKLWYSFPQTTERMVDDGYRRIVDLWSPILDEFDRHKIKFALEVHPTEIAFDYYTTLRLFEEFKHRPALGLNFDPSHLLWQGIVPHLFVRDFAERVYHVHMKDVAINRDGRAGLLGSHLAFGDLRRGWDFRSLGHGEVDFDRIIRELNAAGYNGPLSVEWEDNGMDRELGARESLEFVRRIDFRPSGILFDGAMNNE